MGIGFLVPAFLAGLAALAIPIFMHLRHRDKDRPFRFPSLMFLEQLPIRTSQRQRITDWPLLLLRALAIAALVFAFARPVLTDRAATGGDTRRRAVVLVVDRSLSMGYQGVWPRALDSARAVVNALGAGDRVGVVAYDDASEVLLRLGDDKSLAMAAIATLKPLARGTRLAPALRTARQMLLDAPFAAAEIVVISDLQRAGAAGIAGIDLPAGVRLRSIPVGEAVRANSAVRVIEVRRVMQGSRSLLAVKARVQSHELPSARVVQAHLVVNGRDAATSSVLLQQDGETVVTFAPVPAPDDAVALLVALEADALVADDTLHAVVPRDDAVRVALVSPSEGAAGEALFLERALAIGATPAIAIDRFASAPVSREVLARTNLVLFWDMLPSATSWAALQDYMTKGGGVVIAAGSRLADQRGDNLPLLPVRMSGLADRVADRGGTLRDVRIEHPLFRLFREVPDALGTVRFLRYPRVDISGAVDVLARFDDGLPAVLEQRIGEGRLVVLTVPLDAQRSDFPLQPAFLPFVRQLVLYTSGRDAVPLWRSTSESWSLAPSVKDPVVRAPDGTLLRPRADLLSPAVPLADAGLYEAFAVSATGTAVGRVAVNAPASESELTPMDTTELLLGVRDAEPGTMASNAPPTTAELERRQNPWRVLLIIVALVLVVETIMATRGWRAVARRVRPASPLSSSASSSASASNRSPT